MYKDLMKFKGFIKIANVGTEVQDSLVDALPNLKCL